MASDTEWADILAECEGILDETIEALAGIARGADMHDTLKPAGLSHLYDMAEDVAASGRLRRAEERLAWRRAR